MRLSELKGSAKIKSFSNGVVSERLLAMGCRKGFSVEFVLCGKTMCEYKIGETLVAVKKSGAAEILVE